MKVALGEASPNPWGRGRAIVINRSNPENPQIGFVQILSIANSEPILKVCYGRFLEFSDNGYQHDLEKLGWTEYFQPPNKSWIDPLE